jgi:hypothetical protein
MPIIGNIASAGKKPSTPTIGTATDGGTGTTVSVAFTPSTYIGKSTITYTATSSPGSLTGTGSGSPITVSGLTTGTAYTFTVKGDTNYGVASDYSAASNSVTPASPSSFESIASAAGNGSSNTITFSSIPSTYTSLQVRIFGKDTRNSTQYSVDGTITLNSVTTYGMHYLRGNGTTASASGAASNTIIILPNAIATSRSGMTSVGSVAIIDIHDYKSTTRNKTVRAFGGIDTNGVGQFGPYLASGVSVDTAAVTSITLGCDTAWTTDTTIALYGVK